MILECDDCSCVQSTRFHQLCETSVHIISSCIISSSRHKYILNVYRVQAIMLKQITCFDSSLLSVAKKNMTELIFQKRKGFSSKSSFQLDHSKNARIILLTRYWRWWRLLEDGGFLRDSKNTTWKFCILTYKPEQVRFISCRAYSCICIFSDKNLMYCSGKSKHILSTREEKKCLHAEQFCFPHSSAI